MHDATSLAHSCFMFFWWLLKNVWWAPVIFEESKSRGWPSWVFPWTNWFPYCEIRIFKCRVNLCLVVFWTYHITYLVVFEMFLMLMGWSTRSFWDESSDILLMSGIWHTWLTFAFTILKEEALSTVLVWRFILNKS